MSEQLAHNAELYRRRRDLWDRGVLAFAESAFPRREIFCSSLLKLLPGHALIEGASGQGKTALQLNLALMALLSGWSAWFFVLKLSNLAINWARSLPPGLCRHLQLVSLARPNARGMRLYDAMGDVWRDAKGDRAAVGRILSKNLIQIPGHEREYGKRLFVGSPAAYLEHLCRNTTSGPHGIIPEILRNIDHSQRGGAEIERALQSFSDNDVLHPGFRPDAELLDVDAALEPGSLTVVETSHSNDAVRSSDTCNFLWDSLYRKRLARGLAGDRRHLLCLLDECAPIVVDSPHTGDWATCREPTGIHNVFASQGFQSQAQPRKGGQTGGGVLRSFCDTFLEFTPGPDRIREMLARAGEHWQQMTTWSVADHGYSTCVSESTSWQRIPNINPDFLFWCASTPNWLIAQCPEFPLVCCRPLFATASAAEFDRLVNTPLADRPPPPEGLPRRPEPRRKPSPEAAPQPKPRADADIDVDAILAALAGKGKTRRRGRR